MDKPVYADLYNLDEDARIDLIGQTVTEQGKVAGVVIDSDEGKAERYIQKLLERFPGVEIVDRFDGPVPNTVVVKVGPKQK